MSPLPPPRRLLNWPDTLVDEAAFRREQARLARVWTFLGHAQDVAKDGDWFRADLATRSVFVQRFGDELRGFENRCAHRSFPLRNADKGNGPILCGFHHWRYDKEGRAVGIPQCQPLFGRPPRELGAALTPVQVAACGPLIFGRFPAPGDNETLEAFLGDGFPIIAGLWREPAYTHTITREVKANWRLCVHITVEEYHVPSVHLPYWGKAGYLKRENIGYFRFGRHSAYITHPDADGFARMAAECRAGTWRSANYRVLHVFPGFAVAHGRADREHWYVSAMKFVPLAPDRTLVRYWARPSPFRSAVEPPWYDRLLDRFSVNRRLRDRVVRYYTGKINAQDTGVCEKLQTIAPQLTAAPILGRLEERISWFEEAYEQAMNAPPSRPPAAVSRGRDAE
ncbi:MAG TPA: Rieske 2Fe-2S domain-containing protein [Stellaceae bacterium]|nr:Rieske 2Fe-2S domain-containing protein [Stellaceae bacterium]